MPQKVVAHALKSCGTCPKKLCHNYLWHVPDIFGACATTSQGMYHNYLCTFAIKDLFHCSEKATENLQKAKCGWLYLNVIKDCVCFQLIFV